MPVRLMEVTPHEIVALKPAGLASELPRDPAADSLVRRLAAQGYAGLRLVHRLDASSCGLMLVARSAEAAAHYAREIAARRWLRATPQAGAEAGQLGFVRRAKEAAVGRLGRPGGTDRPAVDAGRGDADEEHAVEARVTGGQRVVEPAMIRVHPATIRG